MISRSAGHPLGEIRWIAERSYDELYRLAPSFLRRLKDETKKETVEGYQEYLAGKRRRMSPLVSKFLGQNDDLPAILNPDMRHVRLVEYDAEGETKVITGMLYEAAGNHRRWDEIEAQVRQMGAGEQTEVIVAYMTG
jgi:thymidylate synthase ThyX